MRIERWVYTIPVRVRSLFHRTRLRAELDEELRDQIDRQIEDNLSHGMGTEEARLAALRAFGNAAALREQTHDAWSWRAFLHRGAADGGDGYSHCARRQ